jgi:hypothetical protein
MSVNVKKRIIILCCRANGVKYTNNISFSSISNSVKNFLPKNNRFIKKLIKRKNKIVYEKWRKVPESGIIIFKINIAAKSKGTKNVYAKTLNFI